MSKALANPKLFAAAALLFAVASFANLSVEPNTEFNSATKSPMRVEPARPELKASPTIPPSPWDPPPTDKL